MNSKEQAQKKARKPSKRTPYSLIRHKYQGKRFVITIHGAKPENCPILKVLEKQFEKDLYAVVAVAYETGIHGIHPHWQIYLQVEPRVSNLKTLLEDVLRPYRLEHLLHIELAKATQRACINYVYAVRKQHELGWVHYAKGHEVPIEHDARGLSNLLWLRYNMKPWQKEITDMLTGDASFRNILYVHEPVGNTGKSYLAKYLHYFYGAIITGGRAADMKHAISRWKEITGSYPVMILFDIARSYQLTAESYYAMEQMKNAVFFSGKYESGMVVAKNPPHMVVFANHPPKKQFMSQDRWVVKTIDPETHQLIDSNQF